MKDLAHHVQCLSRGGFFMTYGAPTRRRREEVDMATYIEYDFGEMEKRLIAADVDPHTRTAQDLFDTVNVTPEQRRVAKTINYGVMYGTASGRYVP